jgi:hypothetical protein
MRKFLKLIQENKPGISYIIDIKDTDDNLLGSAAIPGPTNTSFYEEFANYLENVHGAEVVGVNPGPPVEDNQGPVEAMAQTNPEAAGLVQDRVTAEGEIMQKYADETSQIKQMAAQM